MTRVLTVIDSTPSNTSASSVGKSAVVTWGPWLGILAPFACAVHCAVMPLAISYLPALGLSFLADETFRKWMVIGCLAIAAIAFVPGFRRHGRLAPSMVGCLGLAMVSLTAFGFAGDCCPKFETNSSSVATTEAAPCTQASCCPSENDPEPKSGLIHSPHNVVSASVVSSPWLGFIAPWLAPMGGVVLVAAHLLNRRECGCCSSDVAEGVSPDDAIA